MNPKLSDLEAPAKNVGKARAHVSQNEGLIFEKSAPGKRGMELPPLDVPGRRSRASARRRIHARLNRRLPGSQRNRSDPPLHAAFHLELRDRSRHVSARLLHHEIQSARERIRRAPRWPGHRTSRAAAEVSQGCLRILHDLQKCLLAITGMDAATLQPAAGAQGELTGLLMIRAYLESQGNPRNKVLIPDSAHGTNPASVVIAGYEVQNIKSNSRGQIDTDHLREFVTDDVAALMLTNPSTLGVFEERIAEIAAILHERGALLYMDGANMNALAGVTRPGDFGVDVMHLNLHKTFSTPHGGGGPGAGPVLVKKILEPFLPVPVVVQKADGTYALDHHRPKSVGRVRAFAGNFGVLLRALAYTLAYGPGIRQATEDAVLNANYIRKNLEDVFRSARTICRPCTKWSSATRAKK